MSSLTYAQLLSGNRPFRNLLAGQVVSELGNWFNFIAVLGVVRAVTNAAPEPIAILVVLRLAPFGLFAPLAGALVDRWSRRAVMIWTDVARAIFALGFLFVGSAEDLWIAYACTVILTVLSAFFDGAKTAAMPDVAGDRGLLAGNALMLSSRFLLMAVGAALGGAAATVFGYEVAFVINAVSFLVSAYSVWLIPKSVVEKKGEEEKPVETRKGVRSSGGPGLLADVFEGWKYVARHPLAAAIVGVNILWATGGGAISLIYERVGSVAYAGRGGLEGDAGVAAVNAAVGVGLFVGMMLARRVGSHVEMRGWTGVFIGTTIIAHGVVFALAGLMPSLWLASLMIMLSRVLIGVEFAVQETLLMRLLPRELRGRVFTTDRAAEILVMSLSGMAAGWLLAEGMAIGTLIVLSGLLSGVPGVMWLSLYLAGKLDIPTGAGDEETDDASGEGVAPAASG